MYSVVLDLVGLYPSFLSLSHNNHRRRLEKDENPMTSYYCYVVDVAGCFSEINHNSGTVVTLQRILHYPLLLVKDELQCLLSF